MDKVIIHKKSLSEKIRKFGVKKFILFFIVFALFVLYALSLVIPFFWIFYNSFKPSTVFNLDRWSFDFSANFNNYSVAFNYEITRDGIPVKMWNMFLNSFLVVALGIIVTLISCSVGSYVVAKYDFPGKKILINIVILAMIVPIVGTLPATYKMLKTVGLVDNILGVVFLYSGGFGFNFLFMNSYFKGISTGYMEAARIDGASELRIFLQIMLPMAVPALTAIGVLTFMGLWSDFQTPSIFLRSMPTVAVGLNDINTNMKYNMNRPVQLAAVIIAILPVLILFIAFQKTIMDNLSMGGGLKG